MEIHLECEKLVQEHRQRGARAATGAQVGWGFMEEVISTQFPRMSDGGKSQSLWLG